MFLIRYSGQSRPHIHPFGHCSGIKCHRFYVFFVYVCSPRSQTQRRMSRATNATRLAHPLFWPPLSMMNPHPSQPQKSIRLYNGLQLPRIAQRVLDHQLAHLLLAARAGRGLVILFARLPAGCRGGLGLLGEVDPAVLEGPAAGAGKVDDGALGVEEEEGLCG